MSDKLIKIDVVSPEGSVYSGSAKMIIARGAEGELGISAGHTQLLTSLPPGPLKIKLEDGKVELLFVAGGIFEVQPYQAIVLADVIERPKDVNEAAALEAKNKAQELLNKNKGNQVEIDKAQKMLDEAVARLHVLELMKTLQSK